MRKFVLFVFMYFVALGFANAQSDNYFRSSFDNYENRAGEIVINDGGGISNYGVGETVPVGEGLLVLAVAGVGYAACRRKRNGKILLALVLLLGLTQCKKKITPISDTTA